MNLALTRTERPAGRVEPAAPSRRARQQDGGLLPLLYYALTAAVLVAAGYSPWRVAWIALPALAHPIQRLEFRRQARKFRANADPDRQAWATVGGQLGFLLTTCGAVAVTGALRSPLAVTIIAPYVAALLVAGDRKATRALLVATGVAMCGLAALPHGWTGPDLPRSFQTAAVALNVMGIGALLAPFHSAVRRVQDDLARAREEMASEALARARLLEQIGTKVGHELKNPLSAVKALVQLAARDADEPDARERLQVVEKEIRRMQEILGDYLSFGRPLQEARPEQVDLGQLVADALIVLSAHADQRRVRLTSHGQAAVRADPRLVKEAIMNLVVNAIEATPPAGEVDVEVRRAAEAAEVVIRDTGRGMTAETLSRVGTPFFTTREEGTGLGVVLARSAVAQHGGSLEYESAPGKGTTATVKLPIAPPRSPDGTRAARG